MTDKLISLVNDWWGGIERKKKPSLGHSYIILQLNQIFQFVLQDTQIYFRSVKSYFYT